MKAAYLIFLIIFIFRFEVLAQNPKPPKFSVSVSVSAPERINSQLESYIKRELRSLTDVTVEDSEAQWDIEITAIEIGTGERKLGYSMSVMILNRFDVSLLDILLPDISEERRSGLRQVVQGLYRIERNSIQTLAEESLQKVCREIVADFDTQQLEKHRKWLRQYRPN